MDPPGAEPAPAPKTRGRQKRAPRPHPYADEVSTARELRLSPGQVTLFWGGLATLLAVGGMLLARRFSTVLGSDPSPQWELWTEVALFGGLGLLGFGVVARPNRTVRFLNVSTFVAAGSYFIIDKLEPLRTWLIVTVSNQTAGMLGLFGQGASKGLVYLVDTADPENPTTFFYTSHFCDPAHPIRSVADYCREHDLSRHVIPVVPDGFWGPILHFNPTHESAAIIPVTVILACTALQSIMLFVGLFMGTSAPWRKKIWASALIAAVVYLLNLLRNTGIIWFYGQGVMSFWTIHDAIGKGGSLLAMIGIAFACFAWFPEFLTALVGVLDLPHRDGPVERVLRLGRRRPEALPTVPPPPPPAPPA
ncbi:MAG: hypothetical protein LC623_09100 [Halobacteriales archaeon]|nr:hypothetical protein [Halobacteriales archaeon]